MCPSVAGVACRRTQETMNAEIEQLQVAQEELEASIRNEEETVAMLRARAGSAGGSQLIFEHSVSLEELTGKVAPPQPPWLGMRDRRTVIPLCSHQHQSLLCMLEQKFACWNVSGHGLYADRISSWRQKPSAGNMDLWVGKGHMHELDPGNAECAASEPMPSRAARTHSATSAVPSCRRQCWAVGPDLIEQFIVSGGNLYNY